MKNTKMTLITILALIFIPPVGIYLIWKNGESRSQLFKIVVTIVAALYFLFYCLVWAAMLTPDKTAETSSQSIKTTDSTSSPTTEITTTSSAIAIATTQATTTTIATTTKATVAEKEKTTNKTTAKKTTTDNVGSMTVYVTPTGEKYHRENCRTIKKSKRALSVDEAISQGYEPCKVCKPPTN